MKSPFPGMDPYLSQYGGDVRASLVVYSSEFLNQTLPEEFVARIERRNRADGLRKPAGGREIDQLPTHLMLSILDRKSAKRAVTTIEFAGPERNGAGGSIGQTAERELELRNSGTSIVDIDLHGGGQRATTRLAWNSSAVEIRSFGLGESLPSIPIPLRQMSPFVSLELQPLIERAYRMGRYNERIDYQENTDPPLEGPDAEWADTLLRAAGKRR